MQKRGPRGPGKQDLKIAMFLDARIRLCGRYTHRNRKESENMTRRDDTSGAVTALIVIAVFAGLYLFHRDHIELDPGSPNPLWVRRTWWGLNTQKRALRWMQPEGYDFETWCARSPSGEWYPAIGEGDRTELDRDPQAF